MTNKKIDKIVENSIAKINADEVVESIARMDANERDMFVRSMVSKWPALTRQITTCLENEMYDQKHYG